MTDTTGSATDTAREQAAGVASDAKDAGARVADTARGEASNVAQEAKSQARSLFHQASGELREQAAQQQTRAAGGLRSVGDELRSMSQSSEQAGIASEVVGQVADRVSSTAEWLDARDPGSLLEEVKSFARQRPGLFIAIAAGAGLVAGRLVKSLAAGATDGGSPTPTTTPQFSGSTPSATTADLDTGTGVTADVGTPTYDAVVSESPIGGALPGSIDEGRP